jgi:integrase
MAYIRQLPSGLWAATVRTPAGRITETRELRGAVKAWADDLESDVRRGDFIDPRAGDLTVGDWWERIKGSRHLELASRRRDESHWRVHVAPRWERIPVGAILRPDVAKWVTDMQRSGVGAATIQGAVGVLRSLMDQAVDARLRRENPAAGVRMPRRAAHVDRVLAPDEDQLLLENFDRHFPGRPDARLFVEVLLYCGLRWEEAGAVDREHVDLRRGLIHVGPVVERDGTIRAYGKSPAAARAVPVDEHLWPRLRARAMATGPGGLLFPAPRTKREPAILDYSHWRSRVWLRGLEEIERGQRDRIVARRPILDDPQPTPHDLRHTFGTRLGDAGLGVHEIMELMGHETLESAQRYLHAGEDRFDRARAAMKRARS